MFIKFGDKTPVVDVEESETDCKCGKCDCQKVKVDGKKQCKCKRNQPNSVKTAIEFLTQKKEKTNIKN